METARGNQHFDPRGCCSGELAPSRLILYIIKDFYRSEAHIIKNKKPRVAIDLNSPGVFIIIFL